jgi:hypothetical protein
MNGLRIPVGGTLSRKPDVRAAVHEYLGHVTRRHFLATSAAGLGACWLSEQASRAAERSDPNPGDSGPLARRTAPLPARARHVIYLQMTGAPSQLDLFDYKPVLAEYSGKDCPAQFLEGKRFAFITGVPQLLGPLYPFHQEARTGLWISDRLPHFESVLDKVCLIKSMQSDQFNHAPAQLLALTGNQNLGYASLGAWTLYGLGSESDDLPGFVVLLSGGQSPDAGKAAWGSGFLPGVYQGVQCRSEGDPVLYLSDPPGVTRDLRGGVIEAIRRLNHRAYEQYGDPETLTRIAQYEMAFRMQISASEAMDISQEPQHIHDLYGTQPGKENFANNCLLARRLVERGVRFIQLFDWGWDHHSGLDTNFPAKCQDIDRPMTALLLDLAQRGLLEETLVIWAGEFGRTPMQENRGGVKATSPGRDHHVDAYTLWMAGGGVRGGISYGETDEIGFGVAVNPVTVRDFHATVLRLLGLDHQRLSFPYQGLDQKLVGVKPCRVIDEILA